MNVTIQFWIYFYAIAAAQGLFMSILLVLKPQGNRKANRLMAALILLLSIYLIDIFAGFTGFFLKYIHFLHITTPLWYFFPVLMYFYVKVLVGKPLNLSWKSLTHLIPFLYIMLWLVPFYFLPAEIKLEHYKGLRPLPGGNILTYIYLVLSPFQLLFYSFLIFRITRRPQTNKLAPAHLKWILFFVGLIMIFGMLQFVGINRYFFTGEITLNFKFFPLAFFSIIIYAVGYLAIIDPQIIAPDELLRGVKRKDIYDEKQLKLYASRILDLIEHEKPFLDSDFRYTQLAAQLGISARYLSEILNREIGKNFNDLINEQRVKEVQKRLLNGSYENYTLLAIAMDSGFNSKASFNRIFKKYTGMTPSEFLDKRNSHFH